VKSAQARRAALPVYEPSIRTRLESARTARIERALQTHPQAALTPRRAHPSDAPAIHVLLQHFVTDGKLLPRTLEQVYRSIRDFMVVEENGEIIACGALRIYSETLAEVGALAVDQRWHGNGLGRRVVDALKAEAQALGIERVFALTLEETFFQRLGFHRVSVEEFPAKIAQDCTSCSRRPTCIEIAVVHELPTSPSFAGRA
jgi:amino-acid N-acetyltransferase